jgi:hypothetical protein
VPISLVTLSSGMQPVSSYPSGQQMKAFEFPLQAALKLRRHRQDLAHRRFVVLQWMWCRCSTMTFIGGA